MNVKDIVILVVMILTLSVCQVLCEVVDDKMDRRMRELQFWPNEIHAEGDKKFDPSQMNNSHMSVYTVAVFLIPLMHAILLLL